MFRSSIEFRKAIEIEYQLKKTNCKGKYTISKNGKDLGIIRFGKDLGYSVIYFAERDDTWSVINTIEGLNYKLNK